MRIVRIFQSYLCPVLDEMALSIAASHHVGQVLRMKVAEKLILFSGNNYEYEAEIVAIDKKKVHVRLLQERKQSRESPKAIHLIQGISKGDKMDFVVQKAVELGVTRISPVITEHCAFRLDKARLEKKWLQWQAIAISACEQCGRNFLPVLDKPCSLLDYLSSKSVFEHFILMPQSPKTWRDYTFDADGFSLFIGPEGGLSPKENSLLEKEGCMPLSLGPRILRTETAAIAVLTLFQALGGDL